MSPSPLTLVDISRLNEGPENLYYGVDVETT